MKRGLLFSPPPLRLTDFPEHCQRTQELPGPERSHVGESLAKRSKGARVPSWRLELCSGVFVNRLSVVSMLRRVGCSEQLPRSGKQIKVSESVLVRSVLMGVFCSSILKVNKLLTRGQTAELVFSLLFFYLHC